MIINRGNYFSTPLKRGQNSWSHLSCGKGANESFTLAMSVLVDRLPRRVSERRPTALICCGEVALVTTIYVSFGFQD